MFKCKTTFMNEKINSIGFLMEQALAAMSETLADGLKERGIDLPHSQYCVLYVTLMRGDDYPTQMEIADTLRKDAAAIKRTLDILERKGYVTRKARNGNSNYVIPTQKAIDIKETLKQTSGSLLQMLYGGFSDEKVDIFVEILTRISERKK